MSGVKRIVLAYSYGIEVEWNKYGKIFLMGYILFSIL